MQHAGRSKKHHAARIVTETEEEENRGKQSIPSKKATLYLGNVRVRVCVRAFVRVCVRACVRVY